MLELCTNYGSLPPHLWSCLLAFSLQSLNTLLYQGKLFCPMIILDAILHSGSSVPYSWSQLCILGCRSKQNLSWCLRQFFLLMYTIMGIAIYVKHKKAWEILGWPRHNSTTCIQHHALDPEGSQNACKCWALFWQYSQLLFTLMGLVSA